MLLVLFSETRVVVLKDLQEYSEGAYLTIIVMSCSTLML